MLYHSVLYRKENKGTYVLMESSRCFAIVCDGIELGQIGYKSSQQVEIVSGITYQSFFLTNKLAI